MTRKFLAIFMIATWTTTTLTADTIERIVAKVNGQIVTLTELDSQVKVTLDQMGPAATPEEEESRVNELRPQILNRIIDNLLVLQVAQDRGLRVPSRFFEEWKQNIMTEMKIESEEELERQIQMQGRTMEDLKRRFEEGLLLQEIRRMEVDSKVSVSEPEIEERYRQRISDFTEPAKIRLREIVVRFDATNELAQGKKARQLLQDLHQGADFAEVARMHSNSSSREAGGDLGFFDQGELAEPLESTAFALEIGTVSEILRLESSFYIIRVDEKVESNIKPIEEVRNDVADAIFNEKMTTQMERFVRELREHAIVEIKL